VANKLVISAVVDFVALPVKAASLVNSAAPSSDSDDIPDLMSYAALMN
jgi:hypothetical protein